MSGELDQLDMFSTPEPAPVDRPAPAAVPRPRRRKRASLGDPQHAAEVLHEVRQRLLGVVEDGDRVLVFEDDDRVRLSLDEDLVTWLMTQGHVERAPARDQRACLHGVIRKTVTPLRLTRRGARLLSRWDAYKPLR